MNLKHRMSAGMSLIELLTVVSIVGILAAIALPSYTNYIMKTNRAAARACMSEASQFMERYYTSNMTYVGADAVMALGCATEGQLDTRYTIDMNPASTQRAYRIRATPIGAQATRDTECGVLTLNQTGVRTEGGTATSTSQCW